MKQANEATVPGARREVEKRSISGSPELFEKADRRMEQKHMSNFSEYVRGLIAGDLERERASGDGHHHQEKAA